jgi:hypothetical protein
MFVIYRLKSLCLRRKILCNILIEFGIHVELVRLIYVYFNEAFGKVCTVKELSRAFHNQNNLKQGRALLPLHFNPALEYSLRR